MQTNLTTKDILALYPNQVESHNVFIVEIWPNESSFTLRLAQNISDSVREYFKEIRPYIQTCLYFGVQQASIDSMQLKPGKILEGFNISIWDSVNPQYPNQHPRMFNSGPFIGEKMLYQGLCYYRHLKVVMGTPRRDLWYPDQMAKLKASGDIIPTIQKEVSIIKDEGVFKVDHFALEDPEEVSYLDMEDL